ncbi:MAG: tetratricopeptide repeat protein [Candidatus Zixiibacteriota bacterium]
MAKISKHDLKEDKFVTFMFRLWDYMRDNSSYFFGIVIIIIILLGAVYGYFSFRKNMEETRVEMLGEAEFKMRFEDYQAADSILTNLVENHGSTIPGKKATFYLANLNLSKMGDYDRALELFEQYLQNPIEGNQEFIISAKAGIAASKEEKREFEEAASMYMELYDEYPNYFDRESLLLAAGRCYTYGNKIQQATDAYQRFIQNHEDSQNLDKAQIALAYVKSLQM